MHTNQDNVCGACGMRARASKHTLEANAYAVIWAVCEWLSAFFMSAFAVVVVDKFQILCTSILCAHHIHSIRMCVCGVYSIVHNRIVRRFTPFFPWQKTICCVWCVSDILPETKRMCKHSHRYTRTNMELRLGGYLTYIPDIDEKRTIRGQCFLTASLPTFRSRSLDRATQQATTLREIRFGINWGEYT